uniref:Uncharacterized protein n=1 Tax=Arundo donax TaxID=35708 RepID=A0A0A9BYC0_ARUDO
MKAETESRIYSPLVIANLPKTESISPSELLSAGVILPSILVFVLYVSFLFFRVWL